jgi:tyrosyl-tRNA synthetase
MSEINAAGKLKDADLNAAKKVLAFETTKLVHGQDEALKAYQAALNMFGSQPMDKDILPSSSIHGNPREADAMSVPQTVMDIGDFKEGIPVFKLFRLVGLADSGGAARRLISQGGAYVNGRRIDKIDEMIMFNNIIDMEIMLRAGKKKYHKIKIK